MLIELVTVEQQGDSYRLSKESIDPSFVSRVSHYSIPQNIIESKFPENFNKQHQFSKIFLKDGASFVVVGSREVVQERVNVNHKQLLLD